MQVKKFEAPTIQEALENVKRELGPEAIILQTKKNKRGFGLLSKASVEITAAISDRSLSKKQTIESRIPEESRKIVQKLPAGRQADLLDKYMDRNIAQASQTRESVEVSNMGKKITATRYIDIEDASPDQTRPAPRVENPPKRPEKTPPAVASPIPSSLSLEDEIRGLKKLVEEMKNSKDLSAEMSSASTKFPVSAGMDAPLLQDAFEQLIMHGIDRRYAYALMKKVAFEIGGDLTKLGQSERILDILADEIMQSVEVQNIFSATSDTGTEAATKPLVIALVGPTGVGKTTTVAKLASEALLKKNLKVGLINLDYHKLGSFDQLATYAKILNVPFRSASSQDDFCAAIRDFQSVDVILVDTAGFSKKNVESMTKTTGILQSAPDLRVYMVLSATTRESEFYDAVSRFSAVRPRGMIVSKLDETNLYGPIYNVSQKVKLPLVYFTTGQRIPEDIEQATRERVVSLVMDI